MNITVTGIDEAITKLEKAKDIDKPIKEGIYEAMQTAEEMVLSAYSSQGGGNNDYITSIEEMPNGYVLTASGGDVGFLEFGAGWEVEPDDFAKEVDFPVQVGSFSIENGGQFARTGLRYWFYGGEVYEGTEGIKLYPTRGMQKALDYLRDNLANIVNAKVKAWIGN